jgi:hypothetical protein
VEARLAGPWPLASWLMVVAAVVAVAAGVLSSAVSPVLILDLVSFWPAGILAAVPLIVAVVVRRSHPRLLAIPALVLLTWIVLGTGAHFGGWPPLPSGQAAVTGSPTSAVSGRLTARLDEGRLAVGGDGVPAYSVSPMREGGPVGAPQVVERLASAELQLVVEERPADRWFRFSGWRIDLAPDLTWALDLAAPVVAIDLRGLSVTSVGVSGSGTVRLGAGAGRLELSGDFAVEVPAGVAATVEGEAVVPGDWEKGDGGSRAPVAGEGWILAVGEGSTVTVRYP